MFMCMIGDTYVLLYVYAYVDVHVYMYIYIHIGFHICVYIYIHLNMFIFTCVATLTVTLFRKHTPWALLISSSKPAPS